MTTPISKTQVKTQTAKKYKLNQKSNKKLIVHLKRMNLALRN